VTEVEIIWPEGLAEDRLGDAADELSAAGIETTCRIQPVRRGAETAVLVLMTTTTLEPILQATFGRLGESATTALKRFVARLFGRDSPEHAASAARAPDVVIVESTTTGAQFLFTADLPAAAYQQALSWDAGVEPGRWMWHNGTSNWLRFESATS
jgi:hypothetical protein